MWGAWTEIGVVGDFLAFFSLLFLFYYLHLLFIGVLFGILTPKLKAMASIVELSLMFPQSSKLSFHLCLTLRL